MVTYVADENSYYLSDEQMAELERAGKMPIVFDDDCPEFTPEMAKKAYRPGIKTKV